VTYGTERAPHDPGPLRVLFGSGRKKLLQVESGAEGAFAAAGEDRAVHVVARSDGLEHVGDLAVKRERQGIDRWPVDRDRYDLAGGFDNETAHVILATIGSIRQV
jgi:hypothetical protein